MAMSWIVAVMLAAAAVFSVITGNTDAVSSAALTGAEDAVKLIISISGIICLWCGVLEVMECSGLSDKLAKLLRPFIRFLFPGTKGNTPAEKSLAANMSANLLGLANAATPAGLMAASYLKGRDLAMLVVINSASIQLIPTTIAAIRQAAGAANGFDIIVPVWITSICSVTVGVLAVKLLYKNDE